LSGAGAKSGDGGGRRVPVTSAPASTRVRNTGKPHGNDARSCVPQLASADLGVLAQGLLVRGLHAP
jgi:hypothetical protein